MILLKIKYWLLREVQGILQHQPQNSQTDRCCILLEQWPEKCKLINSFSKVFCLSMNSDWSTFCSVLNFARLALVYICNGFVYLYSFIVWFINLCNTYFTLRKFYGSDTGIIWSSNDFKCFMKFPCIFLTIANQTSKLFCFFHSLLFTITEIVVKTEMLSNLVRGAIFLDFSTFLSMLV